RDLLFRILCQQDLPHRHLLLKICSIGRAGQTRSEQGNGMKTDNSTVASAAAIGVGIAPAP
ncbi:hypothetical protein ACIPIA_09690, partial [Bosea sp. CER48]|uniref:hypothetical protein n=1 Tax=Bosea sp. CER48 TaxID=3377035 RepID=UPI003800434C